MTWQNVPSNMGGRTRAIMFAPNDANNRKVWAAGVTGGLWYNENVTDESVQWQPVNDFRDNLSVSKFFVICESIILIKLSHPSPVTADIRIFGILLRKD